MHCISWVEVLKWTDEILADQEYLVRGGCRSGNWWKPLATLDYLSLHGT